MKIRSILSLAFIGCVSTAAFAQAQVEGQDFTTLLAAQGINPPAKTVPYRYYMDIRATGTERDGSDETELPPMSARLHIDPSQPEGSRVRVIEQTSGDGETAESLREMISEIENDVVSEETHAEEFWCHPDLQDGINSPQTSLADMEIIRETAENVWLRPTRDQMATLMSESEDGSEELSGSDRKMAKKLAKRLDGQLVLSKPDLQMESLSIAMTRPMTIMIVAKIEEMSADITCAIAPNGGSYMADFNLRMAMSAMGEGGAFQMNVKVSGLEALEPVTDNAAFSEE